MQNTRKLTFEEDLLNRVKPMVGLQANYPEEYRLFVEDLKAKIPFDFNRPLRRKSDNAAVTNVRYMDGLDTYPYKVTFEDGDSDDYTPTGGYYADKDNDKDLEYTPERNDS